MMHARVLLLMFTLSVTSTAAGEADQDKPAARIGLTLVWRRPTILDPKNEVAGEKAAMVWIQRGVQKQVGVPLLPGFVPVALGDKICFRSHVDIRAVVAKEWRDAAAYLYRPGDTLWQSIELDGSLVRCMDSGLRLRLSDLLNLYFDANESAHVFQNSSAAAMSSDGDRVFVVDELVVPVPILHPLQLEQMRVRDLVLRLSTSDFEQLDPTLKTLILQNNLCAFDVQTGIFLWRLGEPSQKDDPFNSSHFPGPPIAVDGKLHVLNEKHNGPAGPAELRLVRVHPKTGRVETHDTLAKIGEADRVTHSVRRRTQALRLLAKDNVLICPTHAGKMIAFDLTQRKILWSHTYREDKEPKKPTPIWPPAPSEWHYAAPHLGGDKLVFTAPDSALVFCLSVKTGDLVWKAERGDDLYLAGVVGDKVLLVGKSHCRALGLDDGKQKWKLATGVPSGLGATQGKLFYLPLRRGEASQAPEIAVIDVAAGRITQFLATPGGDVPGNLVLHQEIILSQSATAICAYRVPENKK